MTKKLITEVVHTSTSREVKNGNNVDNNLLGENKDGLEQAGNSNERRIESTSK